MHVVSAFDEIHPVTWANGAGETTEIVSQIHSADLTPKLRPWRLSIARLVTVGPFSALPGVARTFLPTAEVVLQIDGHPHRVPPTAPLDFDGGQDVRLVELAVPCFAINLMVPERESTSHDDVGRMMMTLAEEVPKSGFRFALTLEDTARFRRFQLLALDAGETVPDGVRAVTLHGQSTVRSEAVTAPE